MTMTDGDCWQMATFSRLHTYTTTTRVTRVGDHNSGLLISSICWQLSANACLRTVLDIPRLYETVATILMYSHVKLHNPCR